MSKFLFDLENEIINRIVDSSKMPYVAIKDNVLEYDEYYNHICKKILLDYDKEDILYTIKNSKKLYYTELGDKLIIALDDGSWIMFYQSHTSPEIKILEIKEYEREEVNYSSTLEEVIEQIDRAKNKVQNLQEELNKVVNMKIQHIADAGTEFEEELLNDLATKLANDYFASKIMN